MTAIFTRLPLEDREELAKLVAEHCQALEEDLKIVGQREGGGKWGPMDLLAVDTHGRLVVIDVALQQGDQLLVEGLAHVGWLCRNRHQMAGLVTEQEADLSLSPRLILVAPDFSAALQEAIGGLGTVAIDLFRFRWLEAGGQKGLLLEPTFISSAKEEMKMGPEGSFPSLVEGFVPLAEEEIATFMKMDPRFTL